MLNRKTSGCHGFANVDLEGCHGFSDISREFSLSRKDFSITLDQPRLKVAEYEITNECILAKNYGPCRFCYNRSGNKLSDELSQDKRIQVTDKLLDLGISVLILGGGEPLDIGIQNLLAIIKAAKNHGMRVFLASNGIYPLEGYIRAFRHVKLDGLSISLDGATPKINELSRACGTFDLAVKTIKLSVKYRIHTSITTVVSKYNCLDLSNMVDLALNLGVDKLYIIPLVCVGRARNHARVNLEPIEKLDYVTKIFELNSYLKESSKKLRIVMGHPSRYFAKKMTDYNIGYIGCTASLTDIGILPDGAIVDCVIHRRQLGNILKMSKSEILRALEKNNAVWRAKGCPRNITCRAEVASKEIVCEKPKEVIYAS